MIRAQGSGAVEKKGLLVRVKARPGASREEVSLDDDGTLRVRVTTKAVDGAANKALVRLLARRLGIPKSGVRIRSGERSRYKLVSLEGVSASELASRLPGGRRES